MRLPISALLMIGIAGILFFLFIGFNYAFNSSGGFVETIWDSANESLEGRFENQFDNMVPILQQGFGIGCVICFLLAIVIFLVEAFHNPPQGGNY